MAGPLSPQDLMADLMAVTTISRQARTDRLADYGSG